MAASKMPRENNIDLKFTQVKAIKSVPSLTKKGAGI